MVEVAVNDIEQVAEELAMAIDELRVAAGGSLSTIRIRDTYIRHNILLKFQDKEYVIYVEDNYYFSPDRFMGTTLSFMSEGKLISKPDTEIRDFIMLMFMTI